MLENFNDVISLIALGAILIIVIYAVSRISKSLKRDDDDEYYRDLL